MGENVTVRDAAYAWSRHRWVIPFGAVVFASIALFAPVAGIEDWPTRIVLGLAGVGVAVMATTDYRVVAETDRGIRVLKASRIRQVAIADGEPVPERAVMAPIGGSIIAADWQVGSHRYTVPRSSEQAMERMAAARTT
jgi:hypothetical protein